MSIDWIGRYVAEVTRHLPRAQREEVGNELRSSLYDELEADASGPASEERQLAALAALGPPEAIAASYGPGVGYLIGPRWFPTFRRVLRGILVAVVGALAVGLVLAVAGRLGGMEPGEAIFWLLDAALSVALWSVGIAVAVFAALERIEPARAPAAARWDPRTLPPADEADRAAPAETVFGIAGGAAGLGSLYLFRDRIHLPAPAGTSESLGLVAGSALPWLAAAVVAGMALSAVVLWQGRWRWYTRLGKLATDLVALFALYRIAAAVAARLLEAGWRSDWLLPTLKLAVIAALAVLALEYGGAAWRAIRRRSAGDGSVAPPA
ncbi:MAG: hypothetical protein R2991_01275 [Thermoanaerobaculia bacterium]